MSDVTNIYLMIEPYSKWFKIGKSFNPEDREKALRTGAPHIGLVCYWKDVPEGIEKVLHEGFRSHWVQNEWFDLDEATLVWLYAYMSHWEREDKISLPIEALQEMPYNPIWQQQTRERVVEKIIERVIEKEVVTVVSPRSLPQIRQQIDLVRGRQKKVDADSSEYWGCEGILTGLVWASGVD